MGSEMCIRDRDTGASRSLISLLTLKAMYSGTDDWKKLILPTSVLLTSASGHKLDLVGYVEAHLQIGNLDFHAPILVYESDSAEFLLGNDIIRDRISINNARAVAVDTKYGANTLPVTYEMPAQPLVCKTEIRIKPYHCRKITLKAVPEICLLYTSPSPRDLSTSRMPSSA